MEALTLIHGLQMGDALIAATALDHGLPVLTANVKHFSPIRGLKVEAFLPRSGCKFDLGSMRRSITIFLRYPDRARPCCARGTSSTTR